MMADESLEGRISLPTQHGSADKCRVFLGSEGAWDAGIRVATARPGRVQAGS